MNINYVDEDEEYLQKFDRKVVFLLIFEIISLLGLFLIIFLFNIYYLYVVIAFVIIMFIVNYAYWRCPKCNAPFTFYNVQIFWFTTKHCPKCGQILYKENRDKSIKGQLEKYNEKCPYCFNKVDFCLKYCPHCGKNIHDYKNESIINERYKKVEDLFNDEIFMKEAKEIRRIYGKVLYISYLKSKAKEFGIGEIEIDKNDIE